MTDSYFRQHGQMSLRSVKCLIDGHCDSDSICSDDFTCKEMRKFTGLVGEACSRNSDCIKKKDGKFVICPFDICLAVSNQRGPSGTYWKIPGFFKYAVIPFDANYCPKRTQYLKNGTCVARKDVGKSCTIDDVCTFGSICFKDMCRNVSTREFPCTTEFTVKDELSGFGICLSELELTAAGFTKEDTLEFVAFNWRNSITLISLLSSIAAFVVFALIILALRFYLKKIKGKRIRMVEISPAKSLITGNRKCGESNESNQFSIQSLAKFKQLNNLPSYSMSTI